MTRRLHKPLRSLLARLGRACSRLRGATTRRSRFSPTIAAERCEERVLLSPLVENSPQQIELQVVLNGGDASQVLPLNYTAEFVGRTLVVSADVDNLWGAGAYHSTSTTPAGDSTGTSVERGQIQPQSAYDGYGFDSVFSIAADHPQGLGAGETILGSLEGGYERLNLVEFRSETPPVQLELRANGDGGPTNDLPATTSADDANLVVPLSESNADTNFSATRDELKSAQPLVFELQFAQLLADDSAGPALVGPRKSESETSLLPARRRESKPSPSPFVYGLQLHVEQVESSSSDAQGRVLRLEIRVFRYARRFFDSRLDPWEKVERPAGLILEQPDDLRQRLNDNRAKTSIRSVLSRRTDSLLNVVRFRQHRDADARPFQTHSPIEFRWITADAQTASEHDGVVLHRAPNVHTERIHSSRDSGAAENFAIESEFLNSTTLHGRTAVDPTIQLPRRTRQNPTVDQPVAFRNWLNSDFEQVVGESVPTDSAATLANPPSATFVIATVSDSGSKHRTLRSSPQMVTTVADEPLQIESDRPKRELQIRLNQRQSEYLFGPRGPPTDAIFSGLSDNHAGHVRLILLKYSRFPRSPSIVE